MLRLLNSACLVSVSILFGACNTSVTQLNGAPLGKEPEVFEKWCRDQQMSVSSSSEERLFLLGERRTFKEFHCAGGTSGTTEADGYALDSVVYSVTIKTSDTTKAAAASDASAETLKITEAKPGAQTSTDYSLLVSANLLSKQSAVWEMGPALLQYSRPLPTILTDNLKTLGPVALGMSVDSFRVAMKSMQLACDEPPKRGQIGGRVPNLSDPYYKTLEKNNNMPPQSVVACNGMNNVALFSDDKLFMYRSEVRTDKRRESDGSVKLLHRIAWRAVSPHTSDFGGAKSSGHIQTRDVWKAKFFGKDSVLITMNDEKESYLVLGDIRTARTLCSQQRYESENGLGKMHDSCGEAGQILDAYYCPPETKYRGNGELIEGMFAYQEDCISKDGKAGPPMRLWLAGSKSTYLARESNPLGAGVDNCFNEDGTSLTCSEFEKKFSEH